ncbi:hypothetical protein BJ322DRAFT_649215 [Thelephora terrestris]|uniref:Karyogamy protein 5 n=1 Tax=Thelephora terrestris TaxID=56493 RepID=A0A9P6HLH5_9AGAM|nr:hypothetical protein BJ322DRAFT_649215 [Thelephora terrestris]
MISAALAQNVNKPDCFRTAIGQMQQRCADLDGLEEEKISFAISMTLCELEIAHLSPPMECRLIQNAAATPMKRRHCVEALARSAQSWSSYSGYFRESTRMCYAYQQLNDIDVAKDIYQNITAEKLRLVRFLLGREQSFQKNDQQLSVSLESMHEILGDLRGFSGVFNSVVADMTDLSRGIMKHVTASLDETLTLISRQQIEQQAHALLEVDTGISRILSKHAESLEGAVKTLGNELSYHSETLLQQVNLHDDELSRVMNQVNHQWNEMIGGISSLHLSISQASQATDRVGQQLQAHQEETAASYLVQLAATKNAEQLALALENLTSTTHVELQQISNATQRITESLSVPQGQATRIWYSILLGAFRIFGRGVIFCKHPLWSLIRSLVGNLPAYHQVSEHAVFRILIMVGHLAWSTAWFLLSAMMVIIVPELGRLLTQPPERIVTPVEALAFQAEETL